MTREVIHLLKTNPIAFQRAANYDKQFEIRKHDRDFQRGDRLLLVEMRNPYGEGTGRTLVTRVQYVMTPEAARANGADGIKDGFCVLGIAGGRPVEDEEADIQQAATRMIEEAFLTIHKWPPKRKVAEEEPETENGLEEGEDEEASDE